MNDEQLDDLLKDLDTALEVSPSPRVAARVRQRIEAGADAPVRWPRLMAVATGAAVLVVVGYATTWRAPSDGEPAPAGTAAAASAPATVVGDSATGAVARGPSAVTGGDGAPTVLAAGADPTPSGAIANTSGTGASVATVRRAVVASAVVDDPPAPIRLGQPEVIIPAGAREAFAAVEAAMRAGRLSVAGLADAPATFGPVAIVPTVIRIPLPSDGTEANGPGLPNEDAAEELFDFDRPLERTRS